MEVGVAGDPSLRCSFSKDVSVNDNSSNSDNLCTSSDSTFRSTLRGLTVGSLLLAHDHTLAPCLVFGSSFCGWLPVLEQLGFTPVGIVLHSNS